MAPKESPLFQFIKDALMDQKYPNLNWINRDEKKICLDCPLKCKSGWQPIYEKIYNDYAKLKPRKSSDDRQRFLQAMKVCPILILLENESSKEKKYYKLLEQGGSSDNLTDEFDALLASSEDMDVQSVQLSGTSKSGLFTGGASVEESGKDLVNISSPMLADNNCPSELPIDWNYDENIENDIDQLLSRLNAIEPNCSIPFLANSNDSLPDVFANTEISRLPKQEIGSNLEDSRMDWMVPVETTADNPESYENGASTLFPDANDLIRSSVSCNAPPDTSDTFHLGEELSYPFNFPPEYDPEKDLIQSVMVRAETEAIDPLAVVLKTDQLGNGQVMPATSGESLKLGVVDVFPLNDSDDIVKRLQQNRSSLDDNREKRYFMMVLKPGQI